MKIYDKDSDVDASVAAGRYTVTVTSSSVTNSSGSNDATSRGRMSKDDPSTPSTAVYSTNARLLTFDLYIQADGKLSTEGMSSGGVADSDGVTYTFYVSVDGVNPSGATTPDTSVVVDFTASAAVYSA